MQDLMVEKQMNENANGAEITIAKLETISHITIIGVYRSTQVATQ